MRKRIRGTYNARLPSLFGLAPGGVYRAVPVTSDAVRSYRTLSPLPVFRKTIGGLLSVALSLGSPPAGVTRHPVSVEPGLSSPGFLRQRPSGRLTISAFKLPAETGQEFSYHLALARGSGNNARG